MHLTWNVLRYSECIKKQDSKKCFDVQQKNYLMFDPLDTLSYSPNFLPSSINGGLPVAISTTVQPETKFAR